LSRRRGLGRGLEALIPAREDAVKGEQIQEIEIDQIRPARGQARMSFDGEKLAGLAASIKEHGVIQPVVVRPLREGGYELIAGERRWRACGMLGRKKIPAVVKEYEDIEAAAISLIENIQREDLNPLEEAMAYQKLMNEFKMTQAELSERVGRSRPFIANMVRLLSLPEEIKKMLADGRLGAGHARALLAVNDQQKQIAAAEKIAGRQLSVRQAEEIAKKMAEESNKIKNEETAERSSFIREKEKELRDYLGAAVKIRERGKGGGRLEIEFENEDHLKRIVETVMGNKM